MYNIKLENYVPKPKPATTDRIVAAHYYAAWKKGAAGLHEGFDDLHNYPERTPLMGYYDEENPTVADWEIKWAVEHGINCFIHCWYRKLDNMGKPVTKDDLRCGHGLHEALFNARYQKLMKFALMFENDNKWGTTDAVDIVENLMPFWTENYFKRENYLILDNKPVMFIYNQPRLDEVFKNPEEQKLAFDACRQYAKNAGFSGMYFGLCDPPHEKVVVDESIARGYDFRFGYVSGYAPDEDMPDEEEVINAQCEILNEYLESDPMRRVATASCFWDCAPRLTERWAERGYDVYRELKTWYLSPDNFRCLIHRMKKMTDVLPDGAWGKRIFMIDNWNEWDEGHYIAPSHGFGFKYLQAIREVFTKHDNLPDYRTPQDLGLLNYNKSWKIPDFSGITDKRPMKY
ncbi:MAG: glycoside hydrolase family 99-like domain-containing protein [Lachnospiraceae bacterium]|nr:glycoside hydrolase family 99-like domain-containing protein [Lachnospiraceae bacterium]